MPSSDSYPKESESVFPEVNLSEKKLEGQVCASLDMLLARIAEVEIPYTCIVFLGRSATPAMWTYLSARDVLLENADPINKPDKILPLCACLNTGKKNFRSKYMPNKGSSFKGDSKYFVGKWDTDENIAEYQANIAADTVTLEQVRASLEEQLDRSAFLGGNVLIVDDIEGQGVQQLFAETVLQVLYHPKSVSYLALGDSYLTEGLGISDDYRSVTSDPTVVYENKRKIGNIVEKHLLSHKGTIK